VEIPRSRNWIVFNGTAAQVESALHSEVRSYTANGKMFYANSAEPSVLPHWQVSFSDFAGSIISREGHAGSRASAPRSSRTSLPVFPGLILFHRVTSRRSTT